MTLQQVRKVTSETEYDVVIQVSEGQYDVVRLKYDGNIERHARNLQKLESAKKAIVTDISKNRVTGVLTISCKLGE